MGESGEVAELFEAAVARFRDSGYRFYLAATLLEHAEWLGETGRGDEAVPLLLEAREIFGDLAAVPWLDRADRVEATVARGDGRVDASGSREPVEL